MLMMNYYMYQMWQQRQSVEVSLGVSESSVSVNLPSSLDFPFFLHLKTHQSFITAKTEGKSQVQTRTLMFFWGGFVLLIHKQDAFHSSVAFNNHHHKPFIFLTLIHVLVHYS